jgi:hypothetical protein
MRVSVRDEGTTWEYPLDVSADNLLIGAMIIGPIAGIMGDFSEGYGFLGIVFRVIVNLISLCVGAFVVSEVIGLLQLSRLLLRGYRLCPEEVRALFTQTLNNAGIKRSIILWNPTNFAIDARSFGSFLMKGVALTGGTVALAGSDGDA